MRYLLLTYIHKPNGQIDEHMVVSNKIRKTEWSTANVILDFKEQKVLRATMDGVVVPKDWDRVVSYYYQYYQATFERLFEENGHELPTAEPETDPS